MQSFSPSPSAGPMSDGHQPISSSGPSGMPPVPFPTYRPLGHSEGGGDLPSYPPSIMEGPHSAHPVLPDGGRVSNLPLTLSLPIAALTAWALNFPFYFMDAAATNAWRARAVDYSIGVACAGTAASPFLCAEKRWSAGTLRGWKMAAARTGQSGKVELVYLLAYTVSLSSGVSSLGFAIRSFKEGDSGDGLLALIQALWEVVPVVLLVMLAIRKLLPLIGGPSSTA